MTKIGIITGSVRSERVNRQVADYVLDAAKAHRSDVEFELVDIKDYDLPLVDYVAGAMGGNYPDDEVNRWAEKIASLDGFIFVTPEYNKNVSPALLNALDVIYPEWSNKAAGIVGYGSTGALTAIQLLRVTLSNFNVATIGQITDYNIFTDFEDGVFKPADFRLATLQGTIDGTIAWAEALKSTRQ